MISSFLIETFTMDANSLTLSFSLTFPRSQTRAMHKDTGKILIMVNYANNNRAIMLGRDVLDS